MIRRPLRLLPFAMIQLACFSRPDRPDLGGGDGSSSTTHSSSDTTAPPSTQTGADATGTLDGSDTSTDGGSTSLTDASSSSGSESSTGDTMARCDLDAPFGAAVPIDAVNTVDDERFGWFTEDELTMYFDRGGPGWDQGGPGTLQIYVTTRSSVDEEFGAPTLLAGVNATNYQGTPRLSEDGLILFASAWDGDWNVVAATRADLDSDFGPHALVEGLNGPFNDGEPFPAKDGSLFFSSVGQGNGDIFVAPPTDLGPGAPEPLAGVDLATDGFDGAPALTPDQLTLYFVSNRWGGAGALDIYVAQRESVDEPFGAAQHVDELATIDDDVASWVSADGCALLLSRPTPAGDTDIFFTTRSPAR